MSSVGTLKEPLKNISQAGRLVA